MSCVFFYEKSENWWTYLYLFEHQQSAIKKFIIDQFIQLISKGNFLSTQPIQTDKNSNTHILLPLSPDLNGSLTKCNNKVLINLHDIIARFFRRQNLWLSLIIKFERQGILWLIILLFVVLSYIMNSKAHPYIDNYQIFVFELVRI